jgi:hypothetical protein
MKEIKALYLKYVQQGFPPKEAAKRVQLETGLSAATGRPMQKNTNVRQEDFKGQYG